MFSVVKYDPERHAAWVHDTFLGSLTEKCNWPWNMVPWKELRRDFDNRLRRSRVGVAVLTSDPDEFLGWAAVDMPRNEIVYAFTKGPYRSRDGFEPRIATSLVTALGVDLTSPTLVRYWTVCSRALSKRKGYQLKPAEGA